MREQVIRIIARNLNSDSINIEDEVNRKGFGVTDGWDSLVHLSIMTDLEDEFDIEIDIDDMENLIDVNSIVAYLSRK